MKINTSVRADDATLVSIGRQRSERDEHTQDKKGVLRRIANAYKAEWSLVGGLSAPQKMPGFGTSTPASACKTGARLAEVPGSTCSGCYAMKGNYLYPSVAGALKNRLYALSDPLWVPSMATLIQAACDAQGEPYFRWHDSGDLQGKWHLEKIVEVAKLTPNIKHWLPTREYAMVAGVELPPNLVVRLSAHMVDGKAPAGALPTSTVSSEGVPVMEASTLCGAYTRAGYCGDCRLCWDSSVSDVTYPKH